MIVSDVIVSKTHGYVIEYKYNYKCQSTFCGRVFGRQSKVRRSKESQRRADSTN